MYSYIHAASRAALMFLSCRRLICAGNNQDHNGHTAGDYLNIIRVHSGCCQRYVGINLLRQISLCPSDLIGLRERLTAFATATYRNIELS